MSESDNPTPPQLDPNDQLENTASAESSEEEQSPMSISSSDEDPVQRTDQDDSFEFYQSLLAPLPSYVDEPLDIPNNLEFLPEPGLDAVLDDYFENEENNMYRINPSFLEAQIADRSSQINENVELVNENKVVTPAEEVHEDAPVQDGPRHPLERGSSADSADECWKEIHRQARKEEKFEIPKLSCSPEPEIQTPAVATPKSPPKKRRFSFGEKFQSFGESVSNFTNSILSPRTTQGERKKRRDTMGPIMEAKGAVENWFGIKKSSQPGTAREPKVDPKNVELLKPITTIPDENPILDPVIRDLALRKKQAMEEQKEFKKILTGYSSSESSPESRKHSVDKGHKKEEELEEKDKPLNKRMSVVLIYYLTTERPFRTFEQPREKCDTLRQDLINRIVEFVKNSSHLSDLNYVEYLAINASTLYDTNNKEVQFLLRCVYRILTKNRNHQFTKMLREDLGYLESLESINEEDWCDTITRHMNFYCHSDLYCYLKVQAVHRDKNLKELDDSQLTLIQLEFKQAARNFEDYLPKFSETEYFEAKISQYDEQSKHSFDAAHYLILYKLLLEIDCENYIKILNFDFYYLSQMQDDEKEKAYLQQFSRLEFGTQRDMVDD